MPAKYVNDLSLKLIPNTRKRVDTGISKKNGTNDENMRPYGPGASMSKPKSVEKVQKIIIIY